jgi:DNA-binding LacI/PurR family transcriptional regulator
MSLNFTKKPKSYRSIASEINNWILNKRYNTGDKIPTILGLHKIFRVNEVTIRRAIRVLKQNGIVEARRGIGITVINNAPTLKNIELVVFMPDYVLEDNVYDDINFFILQRILKGITKEADKLGVSLKLVWHRDPAEEIIQTTDKNSSHLTWYISLFDFGNRNWVKKEQKNRSIFINVDQDKFSGIGMSVIRDFKTAIKDAINYYYRQGKRKFAIIFGDKKNKTHKLRYNLYVNILKEKGITIPKYWQIKCIDGYEIDGYIAAEKLLGRSKKIPEVIFCSTDYRAVGVKKFFTRRKLPVPCLLGFDNVLLGLKENIDTIDTNLDEMGRVSVRMIANLLNKKIPLGQEILVESKFIPRVQKRG